MSVPSTQLDFYLAKSFSVNISSCWEFYCVTAANSNAEDQDELVYLYSMLCYDPDFVRMSDFCRRCRVRLYVVKCCRGVQAS